MIDSPTIPTYALLTDDVGLAIEASSFCWEKQTYLPLLNMPRLSRPDWPVEVEKRIITLRRAGIKEVFIKNDETERVNRIFKNAGFEETPAEQFLQTLYEEGKKRESDVIPKTVEDFAFLCGYRKRISTLGVEYFGGEKLSGKDSPAGNRLLIIEVSSRVLDVSAINYAKYFGYDFKFIPALPPEFGNEFDKQIAEFNHGQKIFHDQKQTLKSLISSVLDLNDIQNEYESVQLIVKDIPIGIFFDKIPAAHMFQVDAEMKLLSDIVETRLQPWDFFLPSYLFVDLEENDLQSEIPKIVSEISKQCQWRFHLNGRRATVAAFKLFCQFFPIDFLMVSGHGGSPYARIAEFEHKDQNGNTHVIKVREFYQFLRVVDRKIEVESKYEPLSIDGVDWKDKEEIRNRGLSIEGFIEEEEKKLISSEDISVNTLEGLVLSNGVFMGNIHFFANMGNPILFLNTCGSLTKAGKLLSFAGARALIGTAWSIFDSDATIFSKEFFSVLKNFNLATAFFEARKAIPNDYSRFSYWYVGTLNTSFKLGLEAFDVEEQKKIMASRMVVSLEMARLMQEKGWMSKGDAQDLRTIFNIASEFCNKSPDVTRDVVIRMKRLRAAVDSAT
jgi:hypothetical protein